MKNQLKKPIAVLVLFAGLAFSNVSKAQASFPYTIQNNLLCSIKCSYTIYDAACTPVCSNVTSVIGPSGSVQIFNCSTQDYMIEVSVDEINGTPITTAPNTPQSAPVTADCPLPGNFTDGGSCSTSCDAAAAGIWSISWTAAGCSVN